MSIRLRAVLEMFTKGTGKAKREVTGINEQLEEAADNAARMNATLSRTKVGQGAMARAGVADTSGPGSTRTYRTQRGVTGARGAEGRDFAAMAQGGGGEGFVAAYATLAANIFAITAGFQALSNAAKVEQLAAGLDLVGARAGVALGITSKGLQQVTDYGISAADAMRTVAQATAAGFSGDEIERLGKVAKGSSVALGRDLGDSMDRLTKGTIKLEPELLDELGIMTRLDDAVKEYADANGKAVTSLTQTERRQAFLNAVLEEGERKFGDIADQVAVNPYDKLASSMKDLGTVVLNFTNNIFIPLAKLITEIPVLGLVPALGILSQALSKVTPNLDSFYNKIEQRTAKLSARQNFVSGLIPEAEAQFLGTKKGSAEEVDALNVVNRLRRQELNLQMEINAQAKQGQIIENFRETTRTRGLFSAIKELATAQQTIAFNKRRFLGEQLDRRNAEIHQDYLNNAKKYSVIYAEKERAAALATLKVDQQRLAAQSGITTLTKIRIGLTAIGGAAELILSSLSRVLVVFTLISAAIALGVAAFKFFFPPSELEKRLDASKAKMKELAEQTKETFVQVQLMLEPGKGQAGEAFDAIATSAANATAEIEKFSKMKEMAEEAKDAEIITFAVTGSEIEKARGLFGDILGSLGADAGNIFREKFIGNAIVKGDQAIQAEITRLQLRLESEGVTKDSAKLMAEQFYLQLAELPIAERFNKLKGAGLEIVSETAKEAAKFADTFKGLEETSKNVNKLSRDLFPKESENALRDLSSQFNDFYLVIKRTKNEAVTDSYARGIGETFMDQKAGLEDTLVALSNQKGTFGEINALQEKFNKLVTLSNAVEENRAALKAVEALGDKEKTAKATADLLVSEKELGIAVLQSEELLRQLALYSKIFSVAQDITKESIALKNLQEKLAKLNGDNAKSALEYSKAMQNAARVATGADITLPQEFSYAYQAKIAEMELNTAIEIANLKKESIDLQMALDIFSLNNQKKKLEQETAVTGNSAERGRRKRAKDIVFDAEGNLRSQDEILRKLERVTDIEVANLALKNFQVATTKEQVFFTERLAAASKAGVQADVNRLTATSANADAQLEASLKQESINITNLKNLDELLKAKNEVTKADKEILDNLVGQSQIYGNIASIFKLETLPALNIQSNILKNQIKLQQDLVDQEKDPASKAEYQRKLDLMVLQDSAIASQTRSIAEQANGYLIANGVLEDINATQNEKLIAESISLQNSEKALANLKEELSLEQKLRDVQLTTARQIAQAEATKRGGEVAPQLERDFARTEASNILKNLEAEKESLVKEKALVVEKMELEKLVMEIRLQAAKQELQNAIDLAPPGTDVSESQSALGKITKAEGLLETIFDKEKVDIDKQFATRETILNSQIQGQKAVLDALPENAREVADRLIEGLKGGLGAALGGIGLTGAAADFYARESQGILNSGMSKEDQEAALANTRSMSSEIQGQQILAEGLNGIYSNLTSGIEGAFMAMIDGSKSAKEAFGEMAAAIIKDIAAMIIKMLVFKAIEMGLNMLLPGSGTAVSSATQVSGTFNGINIPSRIPGRANGGLIALANGGIMDARGGLQGIVSKPTYLVGEGRYNEAVVPLPNGKSIPVQMHGGGQSNNVAVNVNISNSGQVQSETQGQDMGNLGQAIAVAVQKELIAQKMPGGILNRYGAA